MKPDRLADEVIIAVVSKPNGKGDSVVAAEMLSEGDDVTGALVFDDDARLISEPRERPALDTPPAPKRQG